eukprot:5889113-Pleurochrysis_carterae.AAC.3
MPFSHASQASIEIVIRVLPSPISSAKMPLRFFSYMLTSHSRATCWYSRNVPRMRKGTLTLTVAVASVEPVGISVDAIAIVDDMRSRSLWP